MYGASDDTVNRMMDLIIIVSIHLISGEGFHPGKSEDTVNRYPVNRMMTVLIWK